MIKIGSLFSGIGGFELGLERGIPNSETVWQVEADEFCRKVLKKNWPSAVIHEDVRNVSSKNLEPVDIICGGFPCQDISIAGKGVGIHGSKSGLWWEMHRIISEIRPKVAVMENVSAITFRGLGIMLGSLSEIGYDAEWVDIRATDFGAPHRRERIFIVAYSSDPDNKGKHAIPILPTKEERKLRAQKLEQSSSWESTSYTNEVGCSIYGQQEEVLFSSDLQGNTLTGNRRRKPSSTKNIPQKYWSGWGTEPPLCGVDDGIPSRVDRIAALGNAIVPACSEWVGKKIADSGLL